MRLFVLILMLMIWQPAFAGESSGKVRNIIVPTYAPTVIFDISGTVDDEPICNRDKRFAINLATPGGNALYQALLTAKTNDFDIEITGLNSCSANSRAEDVKEVRIR